MMVMEDCTNKRWSEVVEDLTLELSLFFVLVFETNVIFLFRFVKIVLEIFNHYLLHLHS